MNQKACGGLDWGMLILRVTIGAIFLVHGYDKWFVKGIDAIATGFGNLGIPLPSVSAHAAATVELLGGLLLLVGFNARIAALMLAFVMGVAIVTVHPPSLSKPFFGMMVDDKGFEFVLSLLAGCLAIVMIGPGQCSLDGRSGRKEVAPRDSR